MPTGNSQVWHKIWTDILKTHICIQDYLSLLLLSPVALIAQTNGQGLFGVDLVIGLPQDEFKEVNKDALVGVMVNFLYQPSPDIPISIGGDLGLDGQWQKSSV